MYTKNFTNMLTLDWKKLEKKNKTKRMKTGIVKKMKQKKELCRILKKSKWA